MRTPLLSFTLILSLLWLPGTALQAQGKTAPAADYAGESFVIDRSDWVYSENADGTGYREHTVAVTIQSEAAVRTFGVIGIGFASASEHVEIHYARVRHKDGSVTETPASGALEQPEQVTREAPFYSDLKQMQLPVKGMQSGDTLEWQARIIRTRAEAANEFWGAESFVSDDAVTLEETIELRVPVASSATVWTNPKHGVKAVETVEGATKIYRWQSAQLNPTTGPVAEAAKKAKKGKLLTPEEEVDAEEGALPSVAWTTFKTWEAVGAWYRGLEGERAAPDDEIKAKVTELTAGKTTEEEKVRAVYAYVSAQIRYIGVAFGVGRFQPHEAADVLHNQYGDCKDKATLLAAMLAALGLHADSVLIGEGVRWNEALPSPAAFNHLITRVSVGGREVWLDATQEVGPYEVLLFDLRDKPALVIPDKGVASVLRTPKDLPFPAVDSWKAVGSLDKDGVSDSHITMTLRGDDEVVFRAIAHQVAPAQYDQLMQRIVSSMGYGGTVSHADMGRPEDTSGPFVMSFDYHREKAGGDWDHLRTVPQLMIVQLPVVDEKEPPVQTIVIGTPHTELSNAEMKLPAGWGVELPEAVHEKAPFATYDLTYRFEKGTVYTERKLVILQRKIPASEWKAYKKWTDAVSPGSEPYIQLTSGGAKSGALPAPARALPDAKLQDLFQQVEKAYQLGEANAMEDLLNKIRSQDPHARRLLAWEASLAILHDKLDQAIADNEKELAMYPDEMDRYAAIVWIDGRKKDKAAAEATLRRWANAAPQDPKPLMSLAALLVEENQTDAAIKAAEAAVERTSEGTEVGNQARLQLGKVQLKAGEKEMGRATLVALLKSTDDPGTLNDAAYELADAKLELPLAEASARTAVDSRTKETMGWTLDENLATLTRKTSLLGAAWDTLGWALYREGKFSEAKPWITAARRVRGDADVKAHIVLEWEALAAAAPAGTIVADPDANKTDQQIRTVPLGPSGGRVGSAEYRLLLSRGKVERALQNGDDGVEGVDALLKAGDFSMLFPTGSEAKLVRTGMVNCVAGKCEFVLAP